MLLRLTPFSTDDTGTHYSIFYAIMIRGQVIFFKNILNMHFLRTQVCILNIF